MVYNTVGEIKKKLLLEAEDQTINDDEITTYLEDAQEELFSAIQRNRETDKFYLKSEYLNDDDELIGVTYFVIEEIKQVRDVTNNTVIDSTHYGSIRSGNAINIKTGKDDANLDTGIEIEVDYIPKNYKLTERAIAISNILSRLQPFQNDQINPSLLNWREKAKNYLNLIKGKFGVGTYV